LNKDIELFNTTLLAKWNLRLGMKDQELMEGYTRIRIWIFERLKWEHYKTIYIWVVERFKWNMWRRRRREMVWSEHKVESQYWVRINF